MARRLNFFQTRSKLEKIDTASYLERLGFDKSHHIEPDLKNLKLLHKAHLLHIPFENLDIHYGRKISLEVKSLYKKVVLDQRGGLCFELNTLFYHLLDQLGYDVYLASARVWKEKELSPEFDHMIIIGILEEEQYLIDVGFGSLFVEPKKLVSQPTLDYTSYYRFVRDPDENYLLQRSGDGQRFENIYQFNLEPKEIILFLERCQYHQESADSFFKQTKLITQLFHQGRVTLSDRKLKTFWEGERHESPISSEDEFLAKLEEYFSIDSQKLVRQHLH